MLPEKSPHYKTIVLEHVVPALSEAGLHQAGADQTQDLHFENAFAVVYNIGILHQVQGVNLLPSLLLEVMHCDSPNCAPVNPLSCVVGFNEQLLTIISTIPQCFVVGLWDFNS